MKRWVYDIECLPNFFCVVFLDYDSSETLVFEISERRNDIGALIDFISKPSFQIAFNSIHYDEVLLSKIFFTPGFKNLNARTINKELKSLSDKIIDSDYFKNPWKYKAKPWVSIDIYRFWSKLIRQNAKISLKGLMGNTGWPWIQELPVNPHKDVEDYELVLKYCLNDVGGTKHLAKLMADRINLRKETVKKFGINAWSMDNVNLGMEILLRKYCEKTAELPELIKELRSERESIDFSEIILPHIKFKTENFQRFLEFLKEKKNVPLDKANKIIRSVVTMNGTETRYTFGIGGLHTKDAPEYITPRKGHVIIASDVKSYYPNLLMSWGFYPEHLGPAFVDCYREIYNTRIHAKETGDKVTNATYKLALNGLTGNLKNPYSWAFDPKSNLCIVINGQLLLAALAERAHLSGFRVISCNTDGLEVEVSKDRVEEYMLLCSKWESYAKCDLEHEEYEFIARTTVNDYLAKKVNGEVKRKGDFVINPEKETPNQEASGHDDLIIPKALNAYLVEGLDYREFIRNHSDIVDFCSNPKIDKSWDLFHGGEKIQRLSRFYVSTSGKPLFVKKKGTDSVRSIKKDWDVEIVNNLPPYLPGDIEFEYYESKVEEILKSMGVKFRNEAKI